MKDDQEEQEKMLLDSMVKIKLPICDSLCIFFFLSEVHVCY